MTRSVDVIAAARRDLEERRYGVDNQRSTNSRKRELSSQPANHQEVSSAQRRAFFRQLLRAPNPDIVTSLSQESVRNFCVDDTSAEQVKDCAGATSSSESPKRQSVRLERQPFYARCQYKDNEEPRKRDGQINRRRKRRDKEAATSRSLPNYVSSIPVSWTQRLDYLVNVVIGALATALVISSFVHQGTSAPYPNALPLVANAKRSGDQQGILPESGASLHPAQGFNILPKAFPEPLPTIAEDISSLLFLAVPVLASAPGITVLPYTGLPQALPAFPEDIARLILITSPERKASQLQTQ